MTTPDPEFCLLGPLLVRSGKMAIAVQRGKQRALLAVLLLNAGQVVSGDRLAEVLWGQAPPPSAQVTVRNYVMRLRNALGEAGTRIQTQPPGYLISVAAVELDVSRFEALLGSARAAAEAGSWEAAASQAAAALALWRGEPLADVGSEALALREVPRLTELRLQAVETRIEANLQLRHFGTLVAELERLVTIHPLREHLHALLILALYRTDRRADALAVYRNARQVLIEELGAEPGTELRELHQQILTADTRVVMARPGPNGEARASAPRQLPVSGRPAPAHPGPPPRQLPPQVPAFVGRAAELQELTVLLNAWAAARGTTMIAAISGAAGVGKTALAVYWGNKVADSFPDGQLCLNLNGFGPVGLPMTHEDAVSRVLEAMQVPSARIPASIEGRVGMYRTLLSERRMLILLDNARDAEQVRPLLPGGAGSLVLITSRSPLVGLVALEGARAIPLSELTEAEARQMVAQRLGPGRAATDPAATGQLIDACARLPLALAIATALIATRPAQSLTMIVSNLRHAAGSLDVLSTGEAATNLRAVLYWSYQALSPDAARMFRLLAEHPGPDISVAAAAALSGLPTAQTGEALTEISDLRLVTGHATGRFAFHDLLRLYAAEMLGTLDGAAQRRAAGQRMLDHYLHTAWTAARAVSPTRSTLDLAPAVTGASPEAPADSGEATAWMKAEHQVLMRVLGYAADHGFDVHAWQLPWTLTDFLHRGGHWADFAASQRIALDAAIRLGDVSAQAHAHRYIGRACVQLQDLDDAFHHFTTAIELWHQLGELTVEAGTSIDLSNLHEQRGDLDQALACAQRALALYRSASHRIGEAHALNAVGWYYAMRQEYADALDHCTRALELCEKLNYKGAEGSTLHSLGLIRQHLGQPAQAITWYTRAVESYRRLMDRYPESITLSDLGDAYHATGDLPAARRAWQEALVILDDLGHPNADKLWTKIAGSGSEARQSVR